MSTRAMFAIGALLAVGGLLYGLLGGIPSGNVMILTFLTGWFGGAAWIRSDARTHRVRLVQDWSWFAGIGWPFLCLWYARQTGRPWTTALALASVPFGLHVGFILGVLFHEFVLA